MVLRRTLLIIGIAIILVAIGMAVGLVPNFTEVVQAVVAKFFVWISGVFFTLWGIWKAIPEPIQRIIAKVMRKIPNLPVWYKRRTIKFEIEGEVNAALKEFGKEGAGFVEHEVVVDWLKPDEEARRLFFKGGKAYLKLDFNEEKEKTLVEAIVMYCTECLLIGIRQYIERPLMRAIDLTFIDELLYRRNAIIGRTHFVQEVIPREIEVTPEIKKYIDKLGVISQHGLFTRVLMPELKEYPGRTQSRIARANHLAQVEEFIDFLKITAEHRASGGEMIWLHIGETIRVGVILVGARDKLEFEGSKPYVRRTAMHNASGARTVYLIGYYLGVHFVPGIAREAKQRGIASKYEISEYSALIGNEVENQVIARLSIPEGTGKRFLELYANMPEWPDLEEETQIRVKRVKPEKWEYDIDEAWSKRANTSDEFIYTPVAGKDAAEVFGVTKLKDGQYKTIKSIFRASNYLSERWIHDGDKIIKR
jgi:hypothetical protein